MVIVLGSAQIAPGKVAEALALSLDHVRRSRTEPGCLEHGVSVDAEAPNRLVFVERWSGMDTLKAHFVVPASRGFVKALGALSSAAPAMSLFEAQEISPGGKT